MQKLHVLAKPSSKPVKYCFEGRQIIMGRKLNPTKKEKCGPGRKARKSKGTETELVRFLPEADDENFKRLSSCARKRAAKRRAGSVDVPKPHKSPGIKTLPGELSKGAVQARGKNCPAPVQNSDGDEEEDSEEDGVVTQGDLWGSEDSSEDMVDDYGADSNSEDEEEKLLSIERAALKQKAQDSAAGAQWSEEDTDDDGVSPESHPRKDDKVEGDLQINVEDEEGFVLPPAGDTDQDAQAPDLQCIHKWIQDIVGVLHYSYGDFLLSKLMELFPLSELIEFLETNEVPRPITLWTNTLKTRRRDLA